jgi:hypothetical protein
MRAQRRSAPTFITTVLILTAIAELSLSGQAVAGPAIKYVTKTTVSDSTPQKKIAAECPFGWFVLGGAAVINGGAGQVAIQAAFPTFDAGLGKFLFVVKAVEDHVGGTNDNWSVTAAAYCTNTTVGTIVHEDSLFDSDAIKSVSVECPAGTKVVGMGGEVSIVDADPGDSFNSIPVDTELIFHGVEANNDLTQVTARGIEHNAVVGGGIFAGSWKVTAVAACALPVYFDGLEPRRNLQVGGGLLEFETESQVDVFCSSKEKTVIATASSIDDHDQGMWYLDRFIRLNGLAGKDQIIAESFRNEELGTTLVRHGVSSICVDK